MKKYTNVEEYILDFPEIAQIKMRELREITKSVAPNCKEVISYNMPAYKQNGIVVYFAANKNHIGFYPTPNGILAFESKLSDYKYSKGAIQFPIDWPIPKALIQKIVQFRLEEDFLKKKN